MQETGEWHLNKKNTIIRLIKQISSNSFKTALVLTYLWIPNEYYLKQPSLLTYLLHLRNLSRIFQKLKDSRDINDRMSNDCHKNNIFPSIFTIEWAHFKIKAK